MAKMGVHLLDNSGRFPLDTSATDVCDTARLDCYRY